MKNRKYRKRKIPKYFYVIFLGMFLFLGVGYSVINSTLGITGRVVASQNDWSIYFDNVSDQNVTVTNGTTLNFNTTLQSPGDKYEFTFDIVNDGSLDSVIKTMNGTTLDQNQQKYFTISITYDDGTEVKVGDLLKASETKRAHFIAEYKNLRNTENYPSNDVVLNLTMSINFYQPELEVYKVNLNYTGGFSEYKTTNISRTVTLSDLEISDIYKVVACNNGATSKMNEQNKLVIDNVTANTTCRLETSLAQAITNSLNDKTNITVIRGDTSSEKATIASTQDITIDLNGKVYAFDGENDSTSCITLNGVLNVKDTAGNGELNTVDTTLISTSSTSNLNVKNSKLNATGTVISGGGTINIENTTLTSDTGVTINVLENNSVVNISKNCVITSNSSNAIVNGGTSSIVNVRNATVSSTTTAFVLSTTNASDVNSIYVCNTTINNATKDYDLVTTTNSKFFYSENTVFSNTTNTPTTSSGYENNGIKTDIACAE